MTEGVEVSTQSRDESPGAPVGPPSAEGDAANSFLSSALTALDPLDEESVKEFGADAAAIKDLAGKGPAGGGFALEPEAGQKFIAAIDRYLNEVWPQLGGQVGQLGQNPELGDSPYAQRVAQHDGDVMSADDASLLPNLTLLVEGLRTLREGVVMAIEGYREEDDSVSLVFKNIGEA